MEYLIEVVLAYCDHDLCYYVVHIKKNFIFPTPLSIRRVAVV